MLLDGYMIPVCKYGRDEEYRRGNPISSLHLFENSTLLFAQNHIQNEHITIFRLFSSFPTLSIYGLYFVVNMEVFKSF